MTARKGKNIILIILCVTICLFLFSSHSFAQTELENPPYTPAIISESDTLSDGLLSENQEFTQIFSVILPVCDQTLVFGECKEKFKENIKKHGLLFGRILAYAAVREDDVSLCDDVSVRDEICPDLFEILMIERKMAENKCEDFPPEMSSICVNMDNCDKQTGAGMKDMCNGYKMGDISLIKKGTDLFIMSQDSEDSSDEGEIAENLSIYKRFRHDRSKEICEEYASGLEGQRAYICEVLFSEGAINDILDSVADDLAYYMLSEAYKTEFLCNHIKNSALRAGCLSAEREKYFEDHF